MKTPGTPSLGNDVIVMSRWLDFMYRRARVRLEYGISMTVRGLDLEPDGSPYRYRMFPSTESRSGSEPVYGEPGVDSIIYRPYSGWKVGTVALEKKKDRKEDRVHASLIEPTNDLQGSTHASTASSLHMFCVIVCSIGNSSLWQSESLAFLPSSSKVTTMYSI